VSGPELSVVVPSVTGWAELDPCLAALERQRKDVDLEVLVVDRCGESIRTPVAERYPWVRVLAAAPGTSIPDLRACAFDHVSAPSVAVIEDHVRVTPGWALAMLEARKSAAVVGGGIRNAATSRRMDRVAFLCEYGHLLPGRATGSIPGNNVVYDRLLLQEHGAVTHAGAWEDQLHGVLRRAGVELVSRSDIVVDHHLHLSLAQYLAQRYLYARSYAGTRVRGSSLAMRIVGGLGAMFLPPVLLWRIIRQGHRSGPNRGWLWPSLPLVVAYTCAWAAGEMVGYWFGPGDSMGRVR